MTEAEAAEIVAQILRRRESLTHADISPQTRLVDDLGFDSLDLAELFAAIHQTTGRPMCVATLAELQTVGNVVAAIVADDDRVG
jgi:acyl carrier protein